MPFKSTQNKSIPTEDYFQRPFVLGTRPPTLYSTTFHWTQ